MAHRFHATYVPPIYACAPIALIIAFFGLEASSSQLFWLGIVLTMGILLLAGIILFRVDRKSMLRHLALIGIFICLTVVLLNGRLLMVDQQRVEQDFTQKLCPENQKVLKTTKKYRSSKQPPPRYTFIAKLTQDVKKTSVQKAGQSRYYSSAKIISVQGCDNVQNSFDIPVMIFSTHNLKDFSQEDVVKFQGTAMPQESSQREQFFLTTVTAASLVAHTPSTHWGTHDLRELLKTKIVEPLTPDAAALAVGMSIGDRSLFSSKLDEVMKNTGLTHLTAVSGSNCAIVMAVAVFIGRSLKLNRITTSLLAAGTLLYFVILVQPDASVVRSAVMALIGLIAFISGRIKNIYALLCTTILLLLMWDPFYSHDFSFLLSVAATAGIIFWTRPVVLGLSQYMPTWLSTFIAVPTSASVLCTPVLIFINPVFTSYSIPTNILVSPVVPLITVTSLASLSIGLFNVGWAQTMMGHLRYVLEWIILCAQTVDNLPGAIINWPEGTEGAIRLLIFNLLGIYLLLFLLAPFETKQKIWRKIYVTAQHIYNRQIFLGAIAACVTGSIIIGLINPYIIHRTTVPWTIAMCDVGQGDAFLIQNIHHEAYLIDTGNEPRKLEQCLQQTQAKLKGVFISHMHDDHYGSLDSVYKEGIPLYISSAHSSFTDDVSTHFAGKNTQTVDQNFTLEDSNLRFKALWPREKYSVSSSDNENNSSIVLELTITASANNTQLSTPITALFTGDLETTASSSMKRTVNMPEKVDILKISHHGAKNGGTDLIEKYQPSLALISLAKNNSYGHPHADICRALEDNKIQSVLRTDQGGTYLLNPNPDGIAVYAMNDL